jgi:hypothetical protein
MASASIPGAGREPCNRRSWNSSRTSPIVRSRVEPLAVRRAKTSSSESWTWLCPSASSNPQCEAENRRLHDIEAYPRKARVLA